MAWSEVVPELRVRHKNSALVRISMAGPRFNFAVTAFINLTRLFSLSWHDTTRLRLLVGSAESAGLIRLAPSETGVLRLGTPGLPRARFLTQIRLGRWPGLVCEKFVSSDVEYQVLDNALEIILPISWRQDRATLAIGASPFPSVSAASVPLKAARNVPAALMGDPPAKRTKS